MSVFNNLDFTSRSEQSYDRTITSLLTISILFFFDVEKTRHEVAMSAVRHDWSLVRHNAIFKAAQRALLK